ncbi:hypothetical protein D3C81_880610 [compost metagenome]
MVPVGSSAPRGARTSSAAMLPAAYCVVIGKMGRPFGKAAAETSKPVARPLMAVTTLPAGAMEPPQTYAVPSMTTFAPGGTSKSLPSTSGFCADTSTVTGWSRIWPGLIRLLVSAKSKGIFSPLAIKNSSARRKPTGALLPPGSTSPSCSLPPMLTAVPLSIVRRPPPFTPWPRNSPSSLSKAPVGVFSRGKSTARAMSPPRPPCRLPLLIKAAPDETSMTLPPASSMPPELFNVTLPPFTYGRPATAPGSSSKLLHSPRASRRTPGATRTPAGPVARPSGDTGPSTHTAPAFAR